jgi:hypothetical protein
VAAARTSSSISPGVASSSIAKDPPSSDDVPTASNSGDSVDLAAAPSSSCPLQQLHALATAIQDQQQQLGSTQLELSATQSALLDAQQQQRQLEAQLTQLQQQLATRDALCAQLQRCILESEVFQPAAPPTEGSCSSSGDSSSRDGRSSGGTGGGSDQAISPGSSSPDRVPSSGSATAGLEWLQCVHFVGSDLAAAADLAQQPQQQATCPARLPWSKAVGGPGPPS